MKQEEVGTGLLRVHVLVVIIESYQAFLRKRNDAMILNIKLQEFNTVEKKELSLKWSIY